MTLFWIMTALMAALAGLLVLAGARRGVVADGTAQVSASANELAELDRLKARGLMDEAAWTAARAEAGRRILAADRTALPVRVGPRDRIWVLGGVALAVLGALGVYARVATPGLPDQSYEQRVGAWAAGDEPLEPAQVAAVIDRMADENPTDHRTLTMLGVARFEAGDPLGAASAFRRALALQPGDAQSWARLGESLVRANGGTVDADAEAAFRQALRHDPGQLGARYFLGEAALARGEMAEVREMWLPLIAVLEPSDPRRIDLERRLPAGADVR